MITYESKRHPGVFVTSDGKIDPKYNTQIIQFPDGKTQNVSTATIKRWWTEVTDNPIVVDTPVESETPKVVNKPIPKEIKPNKEHKCPEDFLTIVSKIVNDNSVKLKTWESKPRMFAVLNANGRAALEFYKGNNTFKVRLRLVCVPAKMEYEEHKHSSFNATIDLPYTDKGYKALETLIKKSIAYTPTKKTPNTKKEEL